MIIVSKNLHKLANIKCTINRDQAIIYLLNVMTE
ncbi:hypothetical protein vBSenM1_43 [Salmonella phage vB_SenM-1]|uniref:Uncharacterized protein n=1 Tax=Salmonella phage vB_SenM-1 TaxID=2732255 RepID=A0A6M4BCE3_9CAUD|nr:hypothetical protein vBSenM1_43 [Salmonella phage vB_SenM-1]